MPEVIQYDTAPAVNLAHQANAALASAQDLIIDSADMYGIAADEVRNIKTLQKTVEEQRTAITKPLNDALKAVNNLFRAPAEFLTSAEQAIKKSMLVWQREEERKAEVARRAAEAAAAAERARLAVIAEEQRRAAEAAELKALEAQQAAEAAVAAGDAEGAAIAMEEMNQQVAVVETAQAAVAAAEVTTFRPTIVAPAKVAGISSRTTYTAEVTDLMALVQAVATGKAPIQALSADMSFLKAQARAFKTSGQLFPGVTAVAERGISARAA